MQSEARPVVVMRNELREQMANAVKDGGQHTDVRCHVTQHFEKGGPGIVQVGHVFMFQCDGCGKISLVPLSPEAYIFFGFGVTSSQAMVSSPGLVDRFEVWCRNTLIPHARHFAESRCFTYAARAEVAQWVTEQVRDAGPEGVCQWELTRLSEERRLCPPYDLEEVLLALQKAADWGAHTDGRMTLPIGHPYRSW